MRVPTPRGIQTLDVLTADDRSLVGRYSHRVRRFLATGDAEGLKEFEGAQIRVRTSRGIRSHRLITDPRRLRRLADFGELHFEDLIEGQSP